MADAPGAVPATWDDIITGIAKKYQVDPRLALAVAKTESSLNPGAVSPKGARGIMQLMPETMKRRNVNENDPADNIRGGVEELRDLLAQHKGDVVMALRRYNGGPHAPDSATDPYVQKVLGQLKPAETQTRVSTPPGGPPPAPPPPSTTSPAEPTRDPIMRHVFDSPIMEAGHQLKEGAKGFWENANPWPFLSTVGGMTPEDTGNLIAHLGTQSWEQMKKAYEAFKQGHYSEAAGQGAGAMPLFGPPAAEAGETIAKGETARGIGKGVGLIAPFAISKVPGLGRLAKAATPGAEAAETLEGVASRRLSSEITPRAGREKLRWANTASDIAPRLVREPGMGGWSPRALWTKATDRLLQSQTALDAAHDARLSARTFETQPLIDQLLERRKQLEMEAVQGSQYPPTSQSSYINRVQQEHGFGPATHTSSPPIGENVVPTPSNPRVAVIDRAIDELRRLGSHTRYDELLKMRRAYDGPASVKYNPSMTQDFLRASGEASGAADVTGALRDFLTGHEPQIAPLNAEYSFWRSAHDVLEVVGETQQARPAVMRKIFSGFGGGGLGYAMGGVPGALAGAGLGTFVEQLASSGYTTKIQTARLMDQMAQALRAGDLTRAATYEAALKNAALQAQLGTAPPDPNTPTRVATPPPPR